MKIAIATLLIFINFQYILNKSTDFEVAEDFNLELEYSLSSNLNSWIKRGLVIFTQKSGKSSKPNYQIENEELTKVQISDLNRECERRGEYTIRFKLNEMFFYSSINTVLFFFKIY